MELRPMSRAEVSVWYETELTEAFPPNERKPLAEIQDLIEAGCYDSLGLYGEGDLLGYAMMMKRPDADYILLDYLGVTASRRNGGLGADILRRVGALYQDRPGVLAEAELPVPGEEDYTLRRRRIGFYRRCGFTPVYEMASCGVRLQGLLLGTVPGDLTRMMAQHKAIYGPLRTDVKIPLGPDEMPELPHWMK